MSNKIKRIFFDTETTGLDVLEDRIVSIGLLVTEGDKIIKSYYQEINPDGKKSDYAAFLVHGLSEQKLSTLPKFEHFYKDILDICFKYGDRFIIHNADFDTGMISQEFNRLRQKGIDIDGYIKSEYPDFIPEKNRKYYWDNVKKEYCYTGETLSESKEKHFNFIDLFPIEDTFLIAANFYPKILSLDALADFLSVDKSSREEYHGALVDCEILFKCFCKMKETILKDKDFFDMQLDLKGLNFPNKLVVSPENKISEELSKKLIEISDNLSLTKSIRKHNI